VGRGYAHSSSQDKSPTTLCHEVAAWVPDMFCNFCLVKVTKLLLTQQRLKLAKKYAQIWNP
jgi:hypothetical protein